MGNIVLLDDKTINKIAAGEVIERPASVVKELVENSIDAGADKITVEIKNGGISFIRVTDNGKGIAEDDLEIAFERHATSKIRTADDLQQVKSMGFRGEALASIAAISKVTVTSKTPDKDIGKEAICEGGKYKELDDKGCPTGTSITVENLFYNTPVRYKFLKRDFTESGYIEDTITRIALVHPEISFKYVNAGKTVIQTSGNGDQKDVIYNIYGKDVAENILEVDYDYEDIKVKGVIGKPEIARSNRANQLFFVNSRYIKDKTLSSAAEQGFKGLVTIGKFGFLVLNVEIDSDKVDVNVHPAKLEVRFSEEQKVFKAVYHAIKDTLLKNDLVRDAEKPSERPDDEGTFRTKLEDMWKITNTNNFVDEKSKVEDEEKGKDKEETKLEEKVENEEKPDELLNDVTEDNADDEKDVETKKKLLKQLFGKHDEEKIDEEKEEITTEEEIVEEDKSDETEKENAEESEEIIEENKEENREEKLEIELDKESPRSFKEMYANIFGGNAAKRLEKEKEENEEKIMSEGAVSYDFKDLSEEENVSLFSKEDINTAERKYKLLGIAFRTYIIIEIKDDIYLIDQHAAHERILYEKVKANYFSDDKKDSQLMLIPDVITLSHKDMQIALDNIEMFNKAGFVVESFGENTVKLSGVPTFCMELNTKELFMETLDEINTVARTAKDEIEEKFLATVACKAAVKAHMDLSTEEVDSLVKQLLTLPNPFTCPHGRPTAIRMTKTELEWKFARRQ